MHKLHNSVNYAKCGTYRLQKKKGTVTKTISFTNSFLYISKYDFAY